MPDTVLCSNDNAAGKSAVLLLCNLGSGVERQKQNKLGYNIVSGKYHEENSTGRCNKIMAGRERSYLRKSTKSDIP